MIRIWWTCTEVLLYNFFHPEKLFLTRLFDFRRSRRTHSVMKLWRAVNTDNKDVKIFCETVHEILVRMTEADEVNNHTLNFSSFSKWKCDLLNHRVTFIKHGFWMKLLPHVGLHQFPLIPNRSEPFIKGYRLILKVDPGLKTFRLELSLCSWSTLCAALHHISLMFSHTRCLIFISSCPGAHVHF